MRALTIFLAAFMFANPPLVIADEFTQDDINFGGIIYMCKSRAENLGLDAEAVFWQKQREDYVSDELYAVSKGALDAISDSIASVNADLITQRCREYKAQFENPESFVGQEDPAMTEATERMSSLIAELSDELKASGYGPYTQKIMLDHSVTLVNFMGNDKTIEAANESSRAYSLAIEAVKYQRKAFKSFTASSKGGKALLAEDEDCIEVLSHDVGNVKLENFDIDTVGAAAVTKTLYQGVKFHRRALGGASISPGSRDAKFLEVYKSDRSTLNAEQKKALTLMPTICLMNATKYSRDLVWKPLEKAQKLAAIKKSK